MIDLSSKRSKITNDPHRSILSIASPTKLNVLNSDLARTGYKVGKKPTLGLHDRGKHLTSKILYSAFENRTGSGSERDPGSNREIASGHFNRPKLAFAPPLLLKRNSSFFRNEPDVESNFVVDGNDDRNSNSSSNTTTFSPSLTLSKTSNRLSLRREESDMYDLYKVESYRSPRKGHIAYQETEEQQPPAPIADRFIPILQSSSQTKIDPATLTEEMPPPTASPIAHLRAQTKTVFKKSVAQACGLDMNERILRYLPQPPVAKFNKRTYSIKGRIHYSYPMCGTNEETATTSGDARGAVVSMTTSDDFNFGNGSTIISGSSSNSGSSSGTVDSINGESMNRLVRPRKISTNPERILDAPGFQDDFYLNLLSWSSKNVLAIALDTALYMWNALTGDVSLLVDYQTTTITSIVWSDDDCHISIGKDDGNTEIWDTETLSLVRTMRSNLGVRIGSQSWFETTIATGARSGEIQINDIRVRKHIVTTWEEHEGEVCGLSYKNDGFQLASGGNDNTVRIWDTRASRALWTKCNHRAAVKALAWCPYMPNVLASGGGQADKFIHFWNTTTGARLGSINTGSQVSSLHWGQSYTGKTGAMDREIVATGGSPENAISIFNYDSKFKVAEIPHAHESRICTSQLSPDGTTIATVGGDENLKFFKIFDRRRKQKSRTKNSLSLETVTGSPARGNGLRNTDSGESVTRDHDGITRNSDYIIR